MTVKGKILIAFTVVVYSCHNKAVPKITSRVAEPPTPVIARTDIKADVEMGKVIFSKRCGNCHDLPKPEQYTSQLWEGILSYMIPRARLNEEQKIHITEYIKANSQK